MAVDADAAPPPIPFQPFCLPHSVWMQVLAMCLVDCDQCIAVFHAIGMPLPAVDALRLDRIVHSLDQFDRIAHETQQLLYHSDARNIRDLYAHMQLPMPPALVQLLSPLSPF